MENYSFKGIECAKYGNREDRNVCDVVVSIEPHAIATALAPKAAHNKSKKSKLAVGVEVRVFNIRAKP